MARSMLAAIRAAVSVRADEEEIPATGATGAEASTQQENLNMISQADHEAAVSAAETRGREAGMAAQLDRISGALAAEGVNGDGARMSAALDLARRSPSMSGADVAAFVTANVAETPRAAAPAMAADTPAAHDARVAAAALAQPNPPPVPATAQQQAGWAKAAAAANARFGDKGAF